MNVLHVPQTSADDDDLEFGRRFSIRVREQVATTRAVVGSTVGAIALIDPLSRAEMTGVTCFVAAHGRIPWSFRIPALLEEGAEEILNSARWLDLLAWMQAARRISDRPSVQSLRAFAVQEPSDPTWVEVVFQFSVSAGMDQLVEMWRSITAEINEVKASFSAASREWFDRHVGIHLVPV